MMPIRIVCTHVHVPCAAAQKVMISLNSLEHTLSLSLSLSLSLCQYINRLSLLYLLMIMVDNQQICEFPKYFFLITVFKRTKALLHFKLHF